MFQAESARRLQSAGNADALVEDGEIKKRDLQAEISQNQKKEKQYPGASDSSVNHEKNASVGEKRQGGNKITRPPRFEKPTQAKRNGDGRMVDCSRVFGYYL